MSRQRRARKLGSVEWCNARAQRASFEGRRPHLKAALAEERLDRARLCQAGDLGSFTASKRRTNVLGATGNRSSRERVPSPYIYIYIHTHTHTHTYRQP